MFVINIYTIAWYKAWNCNGLTPRLRSESDTRQIREFIKEHNPDVMFLSEVRISAATKFVNGENGRQRKRIRSQMRDNDTQSFRDCSLVHSLMGSPELRSYKLYLSLADRKYAGTAMLHNRETTVKPKKVRYNLGRQNIKGSYHNPDGRVIYAVFDSFSILHTYVMLHAVSLSLGYMSVELWMKWNGTIASFLTSISKTYCKLFFLQRQGILQTTDGKKRVSRVEEHGMNLCDHF